MHALIEPGIQSALGVEIDRIKCDKAVAFLRQTANELQRRGVCKENALIIPEINCSSIEQVGILLVLLAHFQQPLLAEVHHPSAGNLKLSSSNQPRFFIDCQQALRACRSKRWTPALMRTPSGRVSLLMARWPLGACLPHPARCAPSQWSSAPCVGRALPMPWRSWALGTSSWWTPSASACRVGGMHSAHQCQEQLVPRSADCMTFTLKKSNSHRDHSCTLCSSSHVEFHHPGLLKTQASSNPDVDTGFLVSLAPPQLCQRRAIPRCPVAPQLRPPHATRLLLCPQGAAGASRPMCSTGQTTWPTYRPRWQLRQCWPRAWPPPPGPTRRIPPPACQQTPPP